MLLLCVEVEAGVDDVTTVVVFDCALDELFPVEWDGGAVVDPLFLSSKLLLVADANCNTNKAA